MAFVMVTLATPFLLLSSVFASPQPHPAIIDLLPAVPNTQSPHPSVSSLLGCLDEAAEFIRGKKAQGQPCVHSAYWLYNDKREVFEGESIINLCPKLTKNLNLGPDGYLIYGQGTSLSPLGGSKDCTCQEVLNAAMELVRRADWEVSSLDDCPSEFHRLL
jgi:hypothetical protein